MEPKPFQYPEKFFEPTTFYNYAQVLNTLRGVPLDTPIQEEGFLTYIEDADGTRRVMTEEEWLRDDPDLDWDVDYPVYPHKREFFPGLYLVIANQHAEPHPVTVALYYKNHWLANFGYMYVYTSEGKFAYDGSVYNDFSYRVYHEETGKTITYITQKYLLDRFMREHRDEGFTYETLLI